jgi:3-oxoacyl-[acyl-carrier-protein] synthase II
MGAMGRKRRVVITGIGAVAPNGIGKEAFWQNLIAGKSGVDWITAFDPSPYPSKIAAEVKGFDPTDFMPRRKARELWRFTQFALAAARMASDDAKLVISTLNDEKIGACFGTCLNGFEKVEESYETVQSRGYAGLHPLTCFQYSTHAPVSHVAIELGIKGPSMTLASGCSTGLDVIKWASDQIQAGTAEIVIAGSTEAPLNSLAFATWCALGILSTKNSDPPRASRPYDLNRDGLVLAEGAGAVVVESLESAVERGVSIYAEVTGFAASSEALDLRKGDISGSSLARAIGLALASSQTTSDQIDYISSHGNSLPDNDRAETNAFKAAFGQRAYSIPISSIKSMIGQPIAASGILQAITATLALTTGIIPPTINYDTPDPECDLDYVPNRSRVCRLNRVMVNAHAVGGTHSVLILESPKA